VCDNDDLLSTLGADHHIITQVPRPSFNLDAVVQELLEAVDVEDLVGHGLRAVDGVFGGGLGLGGLLVALRETKRDDLAYCAPRRETTAKRFVGE
jgi:hypothetical protein